MKTTGFILRVKSGDKWEILDIAELSDDQLKEYFKSREDKVELRRWIVGLVHFIQKL